MPVRALSPERIKKKKKARWNLRVSDELAERVRSLLPAYEHEHPDASESDLLRWLLRRGLDAAAGQPWGQAERSRAASERKRRPS